MNPYFKSVLKRKEQIDYVEIMMYVLAMVAVVFISTMFI
jgi:hypothetical protein